MRTHAENHDLVLLDLSCESSMNTKVDESEKEDQTIIKSQIDQIDANIVAADDDDVDDVDDGDDFPDYFYPVDSETDAARYDYYEDNDDIYLERHLTEGQQRFVHRAEEKQYQRTKRANKKIKAQRQIKSKHARSIQLNSHNKHLYAHHRIAKQINLAPPKKHYLASPLPVPLLTRDALRALMLRHRKILPTWLEKHSEDKERHRFPIDYVEEYDYDPQIDESPIDFLLERYHQRYSYHAFTINESNIPDEISYDDEMIQFLLEMQNRDLSPEDYEMLLRLDDRVQKKTVNSNIVESFSMVIVDHHLMNDQCSICIENYQLGQNLRRLPCEHLFHSDCIERYLKEFSNQCPLDNLPLV